MQHDHTTHAGHLRELLAARERLIGHAVTAEKIAPDRADDYRRMFDANPLGTAHLLTASVAEGGLMAGLAAPAAPATDYPREWLGAAPASGRIAVERES